MAKLWNKISKILVPPFLRRVKLNNLFRLNFLVYKMEILRVPISNISCEAQPS